MRVNQLTLQMISTASRRWVVKVDGELDIASGVELIERAESLVSQHRTVDFNLSGVSFVDSAGWGSVRAATRVLDRGGCLARVVAPSPAVTRVIGLLAHRRRTGATAGSAGSAGPAVAQVDASSATAAGGACPGGDPYLDGVVVADVHPAIPDRPAALASVA